MQGQPHVGVFSGSLVLLLVTLLMAWASATAQTPRLLRAPPRRPRQACSRRRKRVRNGGGSALGWARELHPV